MSATTTRRRPRLKVVSSSLSTPRRLLPWNIEIDGEATRWVMEAWTEAEWESLHDAERPDNAEFIPGIGWITLLSATRKESDDAQLSHVEAMARHRFLKGLIEEY